MELSSRKTSKRAIEPVDEWLQNEGYYRKHAPKDPTCLFRAVSEQVYQNQRCHIRLRKECVNFMKQNRQMFSENISIPFDNYLDQMACFTEWGGMNEILAMSLMFKRNVVIFHGQKLTRETVIDHGFKDNLLLCFTPPKQYETVYTQEYTANAGFCQSLVYQALYKNVFEMNNVDVTVHKMLHERNNHLRHDKFFLKGNLDIRNQLTLELLDKIEDNGESEESQLLSKGITPFPYRVAKALDPNIYRNVDYDIWHEIRREVRNSGYTKFNSTELQAGAKCLVQIDLKENDKANNNFLSARENWDNRAVIKPKRLEPLFYTGHIQEMSKNEGPVVVFIEELGEKMTVPYESLKPFPQRKIKQNNWTMTSNKKNTMTHNTKWKKPWNSNGRRVKDQMLNDSIVDKSQMVNPKGATKNITSKTDWCTEANLENHSIKLQAESYTSYKEYSVSASANNVKNVLENTHISADQVIEQAPVDKSKNSINCDSYDISLKKQPATNFNHDINQSNKQSNQQIEKDEIIYPPYQSIPYSPTPRFPGDTEAVNYDLIKSLDIEGNDIPYSDPATVRHFFNLGVKYFWSQNMWVNGTSDQSVGDTQYYVTQPSPDLDTSVNGLIPNGESIIHCTPNNNSRYNNRSSPPRTKDQENTNVNAAKSGGQKSNHRNSDFRNATSRDSHQMSNTDVNRNRVEFKNINFNDQQLQGFNNKDAQRGNKSNSMAPRFKKNYDGKNRNDHHNSIHQYRQQQNVVTNQGEMNEISQQYQQQHQQQSPIPQRQTPPPPPLNNSYPYPAMSYNQQVPYIPLSPYPVESEAFTGHYYPPPPSFIQVPYIPPSDITESSNGPCVVPPVYPAMDNYSAQYSPVYSQYVYPAIYPNQPPTNAIPDNCYPPYPGQPYFFPYPPPAMPQNMTVPSSNSQNPQAAPSH